LNGGSPVETRVLTIGATGDAREKNLYDGARAYSFADLKGDIDALGELAGGIAWRAHQASANDWAHAARSGQILLSGDAIGTAAQLARRVADRLKLRQDVFLAEIVIDPVYAAIEELKDSRRYEPLPRFPAVERDFSLLLGDGTSFDAVKKAIESLKIAEVVSVEAGDLFRGKNVPAGKYSLMVRVVFQNREATLTDAQTSDFSSRIVSVLEKQTGAQLRAS
jgi:phenylalanyl-tRNA synthetase beta chain